MKTTLFLFVTTALTSLFVFGNAASVFSQSHASHTSTDKEKEMLCHKWNINNSNDTTEIIPGSTQSTIRFDPDGYVNFRGAKQIQGVWNYDETRNNLFIIVNNTLWKFRVLTLNNRQMVLENRQPNPGVKNFLWRDNL